MAKKSQYMEVDIDGYVDASEWDENDNVIGIKIITDDEDYLVEMDDMGHELLSFIDEAVELTGIVEEEKDGVKSIKIISFEILTEDMDEYSLDYEDDFFDTMFDEIDEEYLH